MSEKTRRTPEENLTKAIFGKFPDYLRMGDKTLKSVVCEVLEDLPKRAVRRPNLKTPDDIRKLVIIGRFGLESGRAKTLKEIAEVFGVTKQCIRLYEVKALRQLRHPSRSKKLKCFFASTEDSLSRKLIRDEESLTEAFKAVAIRYPRTYKTLSYPPFREISLYHLPTSVWNSLTRAGIFRLSQLQKAVDVNQPIRNVGSRSWKFLREVLEEAEKRRLLS